MWQEVTCRGTGVPGVGQVVEDELPCLRWQPPGDRHPLLGLGSRYGRNGRQCIEALATNKGWYGHH